MQIIITHDFTAKQENPLIHPCSRKLAEGSKMYLQMHNQQVLSFTTIYSITGSLQCPDVAYFRALVSGLNEFISSSPKYDCTLSISELKVSQPESWQLAVLIVKRYMLIPIVFPSTKYINTQNLHVRKKSRLLKVFREFYL